MQLDKIINGEISEFDLNLLVGKIHRKGPVDIRDFEVLSYFKKFQPDIFNDYEKKLMSFIGLFYKTSAPASFIEEVYSIIAKTIKEQLGVTFTPVQADAYNRIVGNRYFSFSAPTSAGKSYLFREIIKRSDGDIVIVVPSRALIAEYIFILNNIVDKSVMVLQFVEIVNIKRTNRRIFVITPERGVELFRSVEELNIDLFLFDEAQISEENIRGLKFDAFVRRVDKLLPASKKVFTHPFILNPEGQLLKHGFQNLADSHCYKQNAVGKMYLSFYDGQFSYFTPFSHEEKQVKSVDDIVEGVLKTNGTVLIYTAKSKIYGGDFLLDFAKYVDLCSKVTDPGALKLIEELREFIGASARGKEKHSTLIEMMEKGIVIHHGSIPLKARLIIESFVNANHAKICFSTATLIQGINMPFDVVWIDNFKFTGSNAQKNLNLKNLIGRAGRSTLVKDNFDFGYVVIPKKNVSLFKTRMIEPAIISNTSLLDSVDSVIDNDMADIVQAIKKDEFNDEFQLTATQVQRIENAPIDADIKLILEVLLSEGYVLTGKAYYSLKDTIRKSIKNAWQNIYVAHLRRQELTKSEKTILSAAIPLLLWQIQGKSFKEIVSLRYAFLAEKDSQRDIIRKVRKGEITAKTGAALKKDLKIRYSPVAAPLPDKTVSAVGLFPRGQSVDDLDYDILVYDTYDYLDKVIGLSLTDPLCAAFKLYYDKTGDIRALSMANYIKYGTDVGKEIWLLKYGFTFDEVDWVKEIVNDVTDQEIVFGDLSGLSTDQLTIINRFL